MHVGGPNKVMPRKAGPSKEGGCRPLRDGCPGSLAREGAPPVTLAVYSCKSS